MHRWGEKKTSKLLEIKYLTQKFNRIKTTRISYIRAQKPNCRRSLSKETHTHTQKKNPSPDGALSALQSLPLKHRRKLLPHRQPGIITEHFQTDR